MSQKIKQSKGETKTACPEKAPSAVGVEPKVAKPKKPRGKLYVNVEAFYAFRETHTDKNGRERKGLQVTLLDGTTKWAPTEVLLSASYDARRGMSFSAAHELLLRGFCVARKGMKDGGEHLVYSEESSTIDGNKYDGGHTLLIVNDEKRWATPYTPTHFDMVADDWVVVDK